MISADIATVVGFWAVSIPFLSAGGGLSAISHQERLTVILVQP
jgi:hypothetical protein